jgi:hypothetical protein
MEGTLPLLDDEKLLELGLHVLHEILSRRLKFGSIAPATKKKAPAKKKVAEQPRLTISDEELALDLVEDLNGDSYDSPQPSSASQETPAAPKKKKAPKAKAAAAAIEEEGRVVEEVD